MRFPNSIAVINIIFAFILSASQADACSNLLKSLNTDFLPESVSLCDLSDRYQQALTKLENQGVQTPSRIANLHAPRFINYPDWLRSREKHSYSPWMIYGPAPQTWQAWEDGALMIENFAHENARLDSLKQIDFDFLSKLHRVSMNNLSHAAGKWRTGTEVGKSISKNSALTENEVKALLSSEFTSFVNPKNLLVAWRATQCLEDRPKDYVDLFNSRSTINSIFYLSQWPEIDATLFFTADDGKKRQCGYLIYAEANEVAQQMEAWMSYVNSSLEILNSRGGATSDLLLVVSKIQRWFISIHPYEDGNGRISRYLVDYVMRSLNLPSPIIKDFNDDLYLSSKQWAQEIGRGLVIAVKLAEDCAVKPETKGCQSVGKAP